MTDTATPMPRMDPDTGRSMDTWRRSGRPAPGHPDHDPEHDQPWRRPPHRLTDHPLSDDQHEDDAPGEGPFYTVPFGCSCEPVAHQREARRQWLAARSPRASTRRDPMAGAPRVDPGDRPDPAALRAERAAATPSRRATRAVPAADLRRASERAAAAAETDAEPTGAST